MLYTEACHAQVAVLNQLVALNRNSHYSNYFVRPYNQGGMNIVESSGSSMESNIGWSFFLSIIIDAFYILR